MTVPSPEINNLINLLDDGNETVAVAAMAGLLKFGEALGPALSVLQECDDPLLRKRSHQLQVALMLRQRRRALSLELAKPKIDFGKILIDIHLQWFDNDSPGMLVDMWKNFQKIAKENNIVELKQLSMFMRMFGFRAQKETILRPENYCIGPILENLSGAGAMLCGIGVNIARQRSGFRVARIINKFVIADGKGQVIIPTQNWKLFRLSNQKPEFFSQRELLRYCGSTLFTGAVASDSFRYIYTLGQALSGTEGRDFLGNLPYPYKN